jgi:2,5-diketo-D-gluconate reductase B
LQVDVKGEQIPALGFGTWQLQGDEAYEAVRHALELGHRHIDTAQMYENEEEVGRAIAHSEVRREDVFLTTKVPPGKLEPEQLKRSHDRSLDLLGTPYVDLLLIHWPNPDIPLGNTLEAMRQLQDAEKSRFIGVSNFTPTLVNEALSHAEIFCNQVEYHPFIDQSHLVEQAQREGILLTGYSPLAKGEVLDDETLRAIASDHGKSPAQVAIRWQLQQDNVCTIPRSSSAEHRAANWDVFDFALTDDEMGRIGGLARGVRLIDPPFAPEWEGAG